MQELEIKNTIFESIKHMDEEGRKYWSARELSEKEYNELTEDEKRLYRRRQVKNGNYNLNKTAIKSGVKDLAKFHNAGYKGLYNGETADDIFRIGGMDAKLKRDNVDNEYTANSVHYEVGKEIRDSIKRLGGTMPEDLPTPTKSLKEIEKANNKIITNMYDK